MPDEIPRLTAAVARTDARLDALVRALVRAGVLALDAVDAAAREVGVPAAPQELLAGTVKSFDEGRGFGFIVTADGRRVFFHRNQAVEVDPWWRPAPGDAVEFVTTATPKGLAARAIKKRRADA